MTQHGIRRKVSALLFRKMDPEITFSNKIQIGSNIPESIVKPFPCQHDYYQREREKVNEIIIYFTYLRNVEISISTYMLCLRIKDDFDKYPVLKKARSVIKTIKFSNKISSIQALSQVIDEMESLATRGISNTLMLEIMYFIRGFLFTSVQDPNRGIDDYCKCVEILCKEDFDGDNIAQEFGFILSLFFKDEDKRIIPIRDNVELIQKTFESILPKISLTFERHVLRIVLAECFIERKDWKSALDCYRIAHASSDTTGTFSTRLRQAFCLIKLERMDEALEIIDQVYYEIKPKQLESLDSLEFLKSVGAVYLQLKKPKKAIEIIENAIKDGLKHFGKASFNHHNRILAILTLCGVDKADDLLPPKIKYSDLATVLRRNFLFQENVVPLLNILQSKFKQKPKKEANENVRCKKCSRYKCRHFRKESKPNPKNVQAMSQKKNFRFFKNSAFNCYFVRQVLN